MIYRTVKGTTNPLECEETNTVQLKTQCPLLNWLLNAIYMNGCLDSCSINKKEGAILIICRIKFLFHFNRLLTPQNLSTLPLHISPSLSLRASVEVSVVLWNRIPYYSHHLWTQFGLTAVFYCFVLAVCCSRTNSIYLSGATHILPYLCSDLHYDGMLWTFYSFGLL